MNVPEARMYEVVSLASAVNGCQVTSDANAVADRHEQGRQESTGVGAC